MIVSTYRKPYIGQPQAIKPHISLYSSQKNIPMPLKKVSVCVTIVENICQIEFTHHYVNSSKYNLDCQYNFPVDSERAVTSFTIEIDKKIIQSKIFEAESADQKYATQISQGNSAFKVGYTEDQTSMLSMNIGKLISGKIATFTTTLVGKLQSDKSNWILRIPFSCFPKYAVTSKPNTASEKYTQNTQYALELSCNIRSNNGILLVGKHEKFVIKHTNEHEISLSIPASSKFLPNKDIKIAYSLNGIGEPRALIQQNENGEYACLFNILPSLKDKEIEEGKGEFIFVLDCSGSMKGKKIEYARSACRIFLQSLPTDSYFNIYKFGDAYKCMGTEKLKYTSENLKKALTYVNAFQADMGGTEMLKPLQSIFGTTAELEYPRNIFLLTDGEVIDTNIIFTIIKKNSMNCKVHAVGIGEGASRLLVKGVAKAGNGAYQFVCDGDNISKVIVSMLEKVIKPAITNLEVVIPKECGLQLRSQSKTSFIYQDEVFNMLFISKSLPVGEIILNGMWTHNNSKATYKCSFPKECLFGNYLFPLAVKSYFVDEMDLDKKTEIDLSIRYHVLSKYTKLLGVVRNTEASKIEDAKIFIPMMLPEGTVAQRPQTSITASHTLIPKNMKRMLCKSPCSALQSKAKCSAKPTTACLFSKKEECKFEEDAVTISPLDVLLGLQDISGFWNMSDELVKASTAPIEKIRALIKGITDESVLLKIVATFIAIRLLNTNYPSEKESWKLIENKGMKFLKKNGVDYSGLQAAIVL